MNGPVGNAWLTFVVTLTRRLRREITSALNALLAYYETFRRLVIRDCSLGGLGIGVILHGEIDIV